LFQVITSGAPDVVVAVPPPPVSLWSEHFTKVAVAPDPVLLENPLQDVPLAGGAAAAGAATSAPVSPAATPTTAAITARRLLNPERRPPITDLLSGTH
jgi:hypothetical protein